MLWILQKCKIQVVWKGLRQRWSVLCFTLLILYSFSFLGSNHLFRLVKQDWKGSIGGREALPSSYKNCLFREPWVTTAGSTQRLWSHTNPMQCWVLLARSKVFLPFDFHHIQQCLISNCSWIYPRDSDSQVRAPGRPHLGYVSTFYVLESGDLELTPGMDRLCFQLVLRF